MRNPRHDFCRRRYYRIADLLDDVARMESIVSALDPAASWSRRTPGSFENVERLAVCIGKHGNV